MLARRHRLRGVVGALVVSLLGACGDAGPAGAPEDEGQAGRAIDDDIRARLEALPGVTILGDEQFEDFRFFTLDFEQPADHRRPHGEKFLQRMTLFHRSTTAPMVIDTEGAELFTEPIAAEPVDLLKGNQVTVEHRFYGTSTPASRDWRLLDVWQSAADAHRVVEVFKTLYTGRWLSTGVFRGGTAALLHRYYFPNDVQGTLAYAERHSLGLQDARAAHFLRNVGDATCRTKLTAVQRAALARREELAPLLAAQVEWGFTFDTLGVDKSLEFSVVRLSFNFWEYLGLAPYDCDSIPEPTVSAEELFGFVDLVAGPAYIFSDQALATFGEPESYQSATELGAPLYPEAELRDLLRYPGGQVPTFLPPLGVTKFYNPVPLLSLEVWARLHAKQVLILDGALSPWSASAFHVSPWNDAYRIVDPEGIGFYGTLTALPEPQRAFFFERLSDWAGAPVQVPEVSEQKQGARYQKLLRHVRGR
ncbi:S28 family serine protease [Myxococcus faecalis]|uniref:S28 family serine protease n=1 Tax=Myxococcus faecalis TaxID=3115646 RepID=UPI003CF227F3